MRKQRRLKPKPTRNEIMVLGTRTNKICPKITKRKRSARPQNPVPMGSPLEFDERVATEVAARLLHRAGGKMSYLKLLKLMYLAERASILNRHRPITGDSFAALRKGPILSHVYDLAKKKTGRKGFWAEHISAPTSHDSIRLLLKAGNEHLSQYEKDLIDRVFAKHGRKNGFVLSALTHKLPENRDPGKSSLPISIERILEKAGKPRGEIRSILDDLQLEHEFVRLVGAP